MKVDVVDLDNSGEMDMMFTLLMHLIGAPLCLLMLAALMLKRSC